MKNLNRALTGIRGRTKSGIKLAAMLVMGQSKKNTPVDTGNLKGSHYVQMDVSAAGYPVARIGCTAEYAIYVHENLEAHHPTGKAKFLEDAFHEKAPEVLEIVRRTAKV